MDSKHQSKTKTKPEAGDTEICKQNYSSNIAMGNYY